MSLISTYDADRWYVLEKNQLSIINLRVPWVGSSYATQSNIGNIPSIVDSIFILQNSFYIIGSDNAEKSAYTKFLKDIIPSGGPFPGFSLDTPIKLPFPVGGVTNYDFKVAASLRGPNVNTSNTVYFFNDVIQSNPTFGKNYRVGLQPDRTFNYLESNIKGNDISANPIDTPNTVLLTQNNVIYIFDKIKSALNEIKLDNSTSLNTPEKIRTELPACLIEDYRNGKIYLIYAHAFSTGSTFSIFSKDGSGFNKIRTGNIPIIPSNQTSCAFIDGIILVLNGPPSNTDFYYIDIDKDTPWISHRKHPFSLIEQRPLPTTSTAIGGSGGNQPTKVPNGETLNPNESNNNSGGTNLPVLIGSIVGGVVLILVVVALLLFRRRRNQNKKGQKRHDSLKNSISVLKYGGNNNGRQSSNYGNEKKKGPPPRPKRTYQTNSNNHLSDDGLEDQNIYYHQPNNSTSSKTNSYSPSHSDDSEVFIINRDFGHNDSRPSSRSTNTNTASVSNDESSPDYAALKNIRSPPLPPATPSPFMLPLPQQVPPTPDFSGVPKQSFIPLRMQLEKQRQTSNGNNFVNSNSRMNNSINNRNNSNHNRKPSGVEKEELSDSEDGDGPEGEKILNMLEMYTPGEDGNSK